MLFHSPLDGETPEGFNYSVIDLAGNLQDESTVRKDEKKRFMLFVWEGKENNLNSRKWNHIISKADQILNMKASILKEA